MTLPRAYGAATMAHCDVPAAATGKEGPATPRSALLRPFARVHAAWPRPCVRVDRMNSLLVLRDSFQQGWSAALVRRSQRAARPVAAEVRGSCEVAP